MLRVRTKSALLLFALALALVMTGAIGRWMDAASTADIVQTQDEVDALVAQVRSAQLHFKIQVQEWKNVLLRGHAQKDFDKYQRQFLDEERIVQEQVATLATALGSDAGTTALATRFLDSHRDMGARYREGMALRQAGGDDAHVRADTLVRGIDRAPTDLLDELTRTIQADAHARIQEVRDIAARRRGIVTLGNLLVAVAFLVLAVFLFDRWVTRRVDQASAIAQEVAEGRLDGPAIEVTGQDDLADLLRGLQTMRAGLASARDERQRHERAMRDIVDNVTFGFLIVDPDLTVQPGFTLSCGTLLRREVRQGADLCDLLGLAGAARDTFQLAIDEVFEDIMPEDLLLEQVPGRFEIGGRVVRLDAATLRRDGQVDRLLLTLSDATALEAAQQENERHQRIVGILKQREAFRSFAQDALSRLQAALDTVEDQVLVRRVVHTVKGNAATFGLSEVAEQAHGVEDLNHIDLDALTGLRDRLDGFLRDHADLLDLDPDNLDQPRYTILDDDLRQVARILDDLGDDAPPALRARLRSLGRRPVGQLIGPFHVLVERLGERLGKPARFALHGRDVPVDGPSVGPVLGKLSHLLRNAVDHGLEDPGQRGTKDPTGTVRLDVRQEGDVLVLKVSDDGAGIDDATVLRKAVASGQVSPEQARTLEREARLRLIFLDQVSSRDTTTETSGRGVGMSAVLAEVERAGGSLHIESVKGVGTAFTLRIPHPQEPAEARDQAA